MSTDVHAVLTKLTKVKPTGPRRWSALCPAHADRKPSLSVGLGDDGKLLLYCHAGCELKEILHAMDMQESDLFPKTNTPVAAPRIVATYDYTDAFGQLLYQVLRRSDKSFLQRRPHGRGGWIWNLKDTSRVLYNLPYLTAAPMENWVYVVEGEKDVDNLRAHNLPATCNSGGAGQWHHVADLTPLHGRRVAIIPDKLADQPERHAALERLGRERELFYLLAVSTGLRRKELASLAIEQVHIEAVTVPHVRLHAHQAKSGSEANLPLRADVVTKLRAYLDDRGEQISRLCPSSCAHSIRQPPVDGRFVGPQ